GAALVSESPASRMPRRHSSRIVPIVLFETLEGPMLLLLLTVLSAIDVSALKIGPQRSSRTSIWESSKGELRQLAWSPDGTQFYIQKAEGAPPSEKLHHYVTPMGGVFRPAWTSYRPGRRSTGHSNPIGRHPAWRT